MELTLVNTFWEGQARSCKERDGSPDDQKADQVQPGKVDRVESVKNVLEIESPFSVVQANGSVSQQAHEAYGRKDDHG